MFKSNERTHYIKEPYKLSSKTYYSLNSIKEKKNQKKEKKKENYTKIILELNQQANNNKKLLLLNIESSLTKMKSRSNRLFFSVLSCSNYETKNSDK